ncbi:PIR protein [Plasmodium ovale]|uniref:PIR protein n=1 Tax=Plasmodium ovale TaxID=36330 RepID=A0A1D3JF72_PLAOA|nr:PIR protein [Plasmodium ovale]
MTTSDASNCELTSEKHYSNLGSVTKKGPSKSFCNSDENLPNMCDDLKEFCWKLEENLKLFKEKVVPNDVKKSCTYINLWLQDQVINTVPSKNTIICISSLHSIWEKVKDTLADSIKNSCVAQLPPISIGSREKWKKMHDYNENCEYLKTAFKSKENCKEKYCKYVANISNIYNEFLHVCNGTNKQRCPEYWDIFKNNYEGASEIEEACNDIYQKLGYYKIKVHFGEQDIEEYIEQYETEYIFSFLEKLI